MPNRLACTMRLCRSDVELGQGLTESGVPSVLLGGNAEHARDFVIFELSTNDRRVAVLGVRSYGLGIRPRCLVRGTTVVVGYNDRVAVLEECGQRKVNDIGLLTYFRDFVVVPKVESVGVLCETAIVMIDLTGRVLWRVDTDLIASYRVEGTNLCLTMHDTPAECIDLRTGLRSAVPDQRC